MNYTFDEKNPTPLCEIMGKYGSDKGDINITKSWHNFTTFYDSIFKDIKNDKLRIFELGIGTNDINIKSNMGKDGKPGASLYGWREYFPNSYIFGADIDKNILFNDERIKTFYCDQTNPEIISQMWTDKDLVESFDIIIEDGLHTLDANITFLENSLYKLNKNGYYIIEDIATCEIPNIWYYKNIWQKDYPDCTFKIVKIPSTINKLDNNLLVIHKEK